MKLDLTSNVSDTCRAAYDFPSSGCRMKRAAGIGITTIGGVTSIVDGYSRIVFRYIPNKARDLDFFCPHDLSSITPL